MQKKRYQILCKRIPQRPQLSFSTPHVTTPPKWISFADKQLETKRAASYVTKSTYMCIYYMYMYIYLYIISKGASPHCKILQRITTHFKANINFHLNEDKKASLQNDVRFRQNVLIQHETFQLVQNRMKIQLQWLTAARNTSTRRTHCIKTQWLNDWIWLAKLSFRQFSFQKYLGSGINQYSGSWKLKSYGSLVNANPPRSDNSWDDCQVS